MKFKNKKVIETGASGGIGKRLALAFAEQGADVVISYRGNKSGAEETLQTLKKIGQKALALHADFSEMKNVASFAEEAVSYLDGIDILINNAGMLCRETLFELSPEKMQQVFQVNTISPLYLLQLCTKSMLEKNVKGCVLNISSISGILTMPKGIGYAASKAAMNKWTQNAALNLAEFGVRVNTIAPGVIESGMNENTAETDPELWSYYLNHIALKRAGTPDDIANMAVFLASDEAGWITGKVIEVDGGHVL